MAGTECDAQLAPRGPCNFPCVHVCCCVPWAGRVFHATAQAAAHGAMLRDTCLPVVCDLLLDECFHNQFQIRAECLHARSVPAGATVFGIVGVRDSTINATQGGLRHCRGRQVAARANGHCSRSTAQRRCLVLLGHNPRRARAWRTSLGTSWKCRNSESTTLLTTIGSVAPALTSSFHLRPWATVCTATRYTNARQHP